MKRWLIYIGVLLSCAISAQQNKIVATTEYFYLYGGKSIDEARAIKELPGKEYIIAGTSASFGQGNTSAYLVRTDSMGNHKWSASFGGGQNDHAMSVEV